MTTNARSKTITVDALARRPLDQLEARLAQCRHIERLANERIGVDATELRRAIATASRTATHAAIGQTVKALDRHNIGTIIGLDDTAGQVLVGELVDVLVRVAGAQVVVPAA
mgnify:CR=1 FL=1